MDESLPPQTQALTIVETQQEERRSLLEALSERELDSLKRFREGKTKGLSYPLAPVTQAKLFELYLNGSCCEDIQKLNPTFTLGQVVDACVDGKWEQRRRNHINRLLSRVRDRVVQVQSESVEFMSNMLAAAHKLHGDKLKKFLQTGNEKDLGDVKIENLEQYRKAADVLLKLTGQSNTQKVAGEVTHRHVLEGGRDITTEEQSKLLAELAGDKDG